MRTALIGAALWAAALVALLTRALPAGQLSALAERVWPILLFVTAVTVVAELAAEAGVFDWVADRLLAVAGGRTIVLWLLTGCLAVVSTVFLSLDTTAVLLTPVVVVMARRAGVDPVPFAVTTVWLANTASLLLPVSNLTNLLAENRLGGIGPAAFAAASWPAQLAGIIVPMGIALLVWRKTLLGAAAGGTAGVRHDTRRGPDEASGRGLLLFAAGVLVALMAALVSGVPVWMPAVAAALALAVAFAVARPGVLALRLVPWPMLVFTTGLFLVVTAAAALVPPAAVHDALGDGSGLLGGLRIAGVASAASNLINNLPAYLALEPGVHGTAALLALLVGTNAGSIVTPWGSLATLLWHQRLERLDAGIRWRRFIPLSAVTAVATVVAACLLLALF